MLKLGFTSLHISSLLKLSNDADTAKLPLLVLVEEIIYGDCYLLIKCQQYWLHLCDM